MRIQKRRAAAAKNLPPLQNYRSEEKSQQILEKSAMEDPLYKDIEAAAQKKGMVLTPRIIYDLVEGVRSRGVSKLTAKRDQIHSERD